MAQFQHIAISKDKVMATLMAGLEIEFGRGAGEALAHRFLEAEEVDFRWDARIQERWIGRYESDDEDAIDLDSVRIMGRLDGIWFVATMIVDGEGQAHGMLGNREFKSRKAAVQAYGRTH